MSGETSQGRDWFETVRRFTTTLVGVWGGLWIARIIGWATGLDGGLLLAVAAVCAALGGAAAWGEARKLEPMASGERRDAVVGWSVVGVLVTGVAVAALVELW